MLDKVQICYRPNSEDYTNTLFYIGEDFPLCCWTDRQTDIKHNYFILFS